MNQQGKWEREFDEKFCQDMPAITDKVGIFTYRGELKAFIRETIAAERRKALEEFSKRARKTIRELLAMRPTYVKPGTSVEKQMEIMAIHVSSEFDEFLDSALEGEG